MIKSTDTLVSFLDILGLDFKWPVGVSILAFAFLIINIVGLVYHYTDDEKILLSQILPGTSAILIFVIAYFPNYYWKVGEIINNLEKELPYKIFENFGFFIIWDIMGVCSSLAFGLLSIWAEPNIQLVISIFVFPMVCMLISRTYVRQGVLGAKIYDMISRLYGILKEKLSSS